jgi:hypothetical protein
MPEGNVRFASENRNPSFSAPSKSRQRYVARSARGQPCPGIASMHCEGGPTRKPPRRDRRLPYSEHAVSIFRSWCTLYPCVSRSTCIESTLGSWRATWLRKLRKRRRQRKRPARRKRSSLLLRHIKARACALTSRADIAAAWCGSVTPNLSRTMMRICADRSGFSLSE